MHTHEISAIVIVVTFEINLVHQGREVGPVGNSKGYKSIIVMPDTQTKEKIDTLKSIGADLRLVPAKPYKDKDNYVKYSGRLAKEIANSNNNATRGISNINGTLIRIPRVEAITTPVTWFPKYVSITAGLIH